ncbi:MAG: hypothetical protein ACXABY_09620 [Candidatus Thorarchaeota archaeon]|jgi:hypothetical protein
MKNDHGIDWPVAAVLMAIAAALGLALQSAAGCEARTKEAYYKAETEHQENRRQHEKWLLEKGYIKEPRTR